MPSLPRLCAVPDLYIPGTSSYKRLKTKYSWISARTLGLVRSSTAGFIECTTITVTRYSLEYNLSVWYLVHIVLIQCMLPGSINVIMSAYCHFSHHTTVVIFRFNWGLGLVIYIEVRVCEHWSHTCVVYYCIVVLFYNISTSTTNSLIKSMTGIWYKPLGVHTLLYHTVFSCPTYRGGGCAQWFDCRTWNSKLNITRL